MPRHGGVDGMFYDTRYLQAYRNEQKDAKKRLCACSWRVERERERINKNFGWKENRQTNINNWIEKAETLFNLNNKLKFYVNYVDEVEPKYTNENPKV